MNIFQISSLREEVDILKLHVLWYSADIDLATFMQQVKIDKQPHCTISIYNLI